MGDFAKRLGQLAARSLESESSRILKSAKPNKRGLSLALDKTLRNGHDMKVFGLGTAASLASRERYARFTGAMHVIYSTMEARLDASSSPPNRLVWDRHGDHLRRASALAADLSEVGGKTHSSPATRAYVAAIEAAAKADEEGGGGRLLGHVYCRYFADLFGGQALAAPTRLALSLAPSSPRHYDFGTFVAGRRGEAISSLYVALNEAGEVLGHDTARTEVVREAYRAFALNVAVYREDGRLGVDSIRGVANVISGWGGHVARGGRVNGSL